MPAPRFDQYSEKYDHIKLERDDGILQMTLHTDGQELDWEGLGAVDHSPFDSEAAMVANSTQ